MILLFFLFYIICAGLLLIPIFKIVEFNILNENTLFLLLTNYILNIGVAIFFGYFYNLLFSLIAISFLLSFAFLLIKDFKRLFGSYNLASIPYFLMVFYSFVYILIAFLQGF